MATKTEIEFVNSTGNGKCEDCGSGVRVLELRGTLPLKALCPSCAIRRGLVTAEEWAAHEEGRALAHWLQRIDLAARAETIGAVCA